MAKKIAFDYDLIVIGSGAGGSAAATIAAREGKRVAIVDQLPGDFVRREFHAPGRCLHRRQQEVSRSRVSQVARLTVQAQISSSVEIEGAGFRCCEDDARFVGVESIPRTVLVIAGNLKASGVPQPQE